ncbi:MAG: hypothetical protein JSW00_03560 [Thermoplasmata archaeon]|nr:MAG: hypothetical protein JSW00_03560 [Thermoplasmata archaeon]
MGNLVGDWKTRGVGRVVRGWERGEEGIRGCGLWWEIDIRGIAGLHTAQKSV